MVFLYPDYLEEHSEKKIYVKSALSEGMEVRSPALEEA
jgi:hypothetical protein